MIAFNQAYVAVPDPAMNLRRLGTIAALRQNSVLDFAVMSVATVGVTVPNFVVGPVLTLIFAIVLAWLPAGGWGDGSLRFLILPMIALALPQLACLASLAASALGTSLTRAR